MGGNAEYVYLLFLGCGLQDLATTVAVMLQLFKCQTLIAETRHVCLKQGCYQTNKNRWQHLSIQCVWQPKYLELCPLTDSALPSKGLSRMSAREQAGMGGKNTCMEKQIWWPENKGKPLLADKGIYLFAELKWFWLMRWNPENNVFHHHVTCLSILFLFYFIVIL